MTSLITPPKREDCPHPETGCWGCDDLGHCAVLDSRCFPRVRGRDCDFMCRTCAATAAVEVDDDV
jgi:hypothetical protein